MLALLKLSPVIVMAGLMMLKVDALLAKTNSNCLRKDLL